MGDLSRFPNFKRKFNFGLTILNCAFSYYYMIYGRAYITSNMRYRLFYSGQMSLTFLS